MWNPNIRIYEQFDRLPQIASERNNLLQQSIVTKTECFKLDSSRTASGDWEISTPIPCTASIEKYNRPIEAWKWKTGRLLVV